MLYGLLKDTVAVHPAFTLSAAEPPDKASHTRSGLTPFKKSWFWAVRLENVVPAMLTSTLLPATILVTVKVPTKTEVAKAPARTCTLIVAVRGVGLGGTNRVSLYCCVQLATMIREPARGRRIFGHPVIQAAGYIIDAHGTKQGRQNTRGDAEAIYENLKGQPMEIIIKCLAFTGAVSLLGTLVFVFLALRFAREMPKSFDSYLDSAAKSRPGTIRFIDLGCPRKCFRYPRQLDLSQRPVYMRSVKLQERRDSNRRSLASEAPVLPKLITSKSTHGAYIQAFAFFHGNLFALKKQYNGRSKRKQPSAHGC